MLVLPFGLSSRFSPLPGELLEELVNGVHVISIDTHIVLVLLLWLLRAMLLLPFPYRTLPVPDTVELPVEADCCDVVTILFSKSPISLKLIPNALLLLSCRYVLVFMLPNVLFLKRIMCISELC